MVAQSKKPVDLAPVVRTRKAGSKVALRLKMAPQTRHLLIKMKNLLRNRYVLKKSKSSRILTIRIMITILLRIHLGVIISESQTIQKSLLLTKLITLKKSSSSHHKAQNLYRLIKDLRL